MENYFPDFSQKECEQEMYARPLPREEVRAIGALSEGDMFYLSFKDSIIQGKSQIGSDDKIEKLVH